MYKIETRKDKIKIIRTILESAVLLTLVFAIVRTLNVNSVYIPYDPQDKSVVSGKNAAFWPCPILAWTARERIR